MKKVAIGILRIGGAIFVLGAIVMFSGAMFFTGVDMWRTTLCEIGIIEPEIRFGFESCW